MQCQAVNPKTEAPRANSCIDIRILDLFWKPFYQHFAYSYSVDPKHYCLRNYLQVPEWLIPQTRS